MSAWTRAVVRAIPPAEVQSVECRGEDDGICSSEDGKAACMLTAVVVGLGLCAAPYVTIPALIVAGPAAAPAL